MSQIELLQLIERMQKSIASLTAITAVMSRKVLTDADMEEIEKLKKFMEGDG